MRLLGQHRRRLLQRRPLPRPPRRRPRVHESRLAAPAPADPHAGRRADQPAGRGGQKPRHRPPHLRAQAAEQQEEDLQGLGGKRINYRGVFFFHFVSVENRDSLETGFQLKIVIFVRQEQNSV